MSASIIGPAKRHAMICVKGLCQSALPMGAGRNLIELAGPQLNSGDNLGVRIHHLPPAATPSSSLRAAGQHGSSPVRHLQLFTAIVCIAVAFTVALPASAGEYATKDEAVALVKQAIALVAAEGLDKAAPEFMDHNGKYVDRDLYLIVIDKDGMRIVHGQNPKLVGKPYFDAVDVNGKEYGKEVMQVAAGPGSGWVSFAFKDPITGKVLPKESYVEKAGDYIYVAGVYTR